MKKIDLDKESSFDLEMEIHGDVPNGTKSSVYFTIISEKMRLSFEGKRIENGVYRVNIPVLKNILESGKYDFEVNVLIDGKHFSPIQESLELIEEVKPVIKMKESTKDSEVSIKITESKKEEKPTPAILKKVGLVTK
jgi:hypothetical protein